jgi:5-methylcytosine-specific restriction enzyme A
VAWQGSSRRAELPPDWAKRRKDCLDAAGGRCQQILPSGARCPRPATDADHKNDPLDHDDLQALCRKHHNDKTGEEARAGRIKKGTATRPAETRHPGRIA